MIAQIEGVTVGMVLPVLAIKRKTDSGSLGDMLVNLLKSPADLFELRRSRQCEIEILGKAIVPKVTTTSPG